MTDSSIDSRCEPGQALAVPEDTAASRTQKLVATGGILGAIAASSCCIAPLVLFSLGSSGAWIGNLTALAPYQPYFIAATLARTLSAAISGSQKKAWDSTIPPSPICGAR